MGFRFTLQAVDQAKPQEEGGGGGGGGGLYFPAICTHCKNFHDFLGFNIITILCFFSPAQLSVSVPTVFL